MNGKDLIKLKINVNNKRKIFMYFLVYLSLIFVITNYYYADTNSILRQGMNVWRALFEGRFFQYYTVNIESSNSYEMFHLGGYNMISNLFIAIWQFPLFLIERVIGTNILDTFWGRIWGKSYLIIVISISANFIKKIVIKINRTEQEGEIIKMLFLCSAITYSSVCVMGQFDIVGVLFALISLYYLLNEKDGLFFVFYIISTQFKFFPIFIFIPIFLTLKEQKYFIKTKNELLNIFNVIVLVSIPFVINYLIQLPFNVLDPIGTKTVSSLSGEMIERMLRSCITIYGVNIPLIVIAYGFFCMYLYTQKKYTVNDAMDIIFDIFISISIILFTCESHPYRLVLLLPFMLLLIFLSDNKKRWIIIQTTCTACLVLGNAISWYWTSDFNNMKNMLIDNIIYLRKFDIYGTEYYWKLIEKNNYEKIWNIMIAAFIVFILWEISEYHSWKKRTKLMSPDSNVTLDESIQITVFHIVVILIINVVAACPTFVFWLIGLIRNIISHLI